MSRRNSNYFTRVRHPNAGHKNISQESEIERDAYCGAAEIRAWTRRRLLTAVTNPTYSLRWQPGSNILLNGQQTQLAHCSPFPPTKSSTTFASGPFKGGKFLSLTMTKSSTIRPGFGVRHLER